MNVILGIDFDNTIVSYDDVMYKKALSSGLITAMIQKNKKAIRDHLRQLEDGEVKWQELQAFAYGKGIDKAQLMKGVQKFLKKSRDANIDFFIVSHKTNFASMDKEKINLRDTALNWMKKNQFFTKNGIDLSLKQIFFEFTREEKINRIKQLKCTHFIDDLEETFLEKAFPENVKKMLYCPLALETSINNIKIFQSWDQINEYFFAKRR